MTDLVDTGALARGNAVDDGASEVDGAAAAAATVDDGAEGSVALGRRVTQRLRRITVPQTLIAAAVLVYTLYFTQRSLDIHHALGTASYDSALYDQGIWLLSRFETPFVTLMGRNLFDDHASFILLALVPLYWIWPSVGVLFFAQSAAIGAGAIPVFLYGRKRLGNEWYALVAGAAYLIHPAIGFTNLENFHPDAFLGVFVGFAIYAALESKWRMYVAFVALSLIVKEDASLVLVPLGVWVGVRRSWKIGVMTVVGSLAFMAVAMFVVMRGLIGVPTRNGWRIPFGGPKGVIDTAVTNPTDLVEHLRSDGRPWYLWQMTAPFAWLFVRLPWIAAISGLVLFTNVLSTFWYQYQIQYHYALVAVPALAIGTVHAIGAMRERRVIQLDDEAGGGLIVVPVRALAIGVLAVSSLFASQMWAPVPWGRTLLFYGQPDTEWPNAAREIIADIPPDAIVSAHYRITPHIAHRTEIYQFPVPFRAVLYGPDGNVDGPRLPARAERVEYVVLPVTTDAYPVEDWILIQSAFTLIEANGHWLLYQRDFNRPLPPPLATDETALTQTDPTSS